jgi:hypothetical protein
MLLLLHLEIESNRMESLIAEKLGSNNDLSLSAGQLIALKSPAA